MRATCAPTPDVHKGRESASLDEAPCVGDDVYLIACRKSTQVQKVCVSLGDLAGRDDNPEAFRNLAVTLSGQVKL